MLGLTHLTVDICIGGPHRKLIQILKKVMPTTAVPVLMVSELDLVMKAFTPALYSTELNR
jgi:chemotaxis response regulator CheB